MLARAAALFSALLLTVACAASAEDKSPAPSPAGVTGSTVTADPLAGPCARDGTRTYGKSGQEITGTRMRPECEAMKPQTRGAMPAKPTTVAGGGDTKSGDPKSGAGDTGKPGTAGATSWPTDGTKKAAKATADAKTAAAKKGSATATAKPAAPADVAKVDDGLTKPAARDAPPTSSRIMTGTRGISPRPPVPEDKKDDKSPK